ncbi:hypothetical protein [Fuchsiella alkaliacetigena]|uniref:hypothetical protein n=1 Tax=Fuchsiella alkaliacetigena TaxID=957042 RepID=UPI00200B9D6A|nr:hypothetical protein [Fuchsiella alkaliacetigena]MCK8824762.1 hypothetical protein [Fuchsiella alkaliacetigena]
MKKKILVLVLALTVVLGASSMALAGEDYDEFNITANVLEPISITIENDMMFSEVWPNGDAVDADEPVEAVVTGNDANYTIEMEEQVTLTNEEEAELVVDLSNTAEGEPEIVDGDDTFEIDGTISEEQLEDIEAGEYTGETMVTVTLD